MIDYSLEMGHDEIRNHDSPYPRISIRILIIHLFKLVICVVAAIIIIIIVIIFQELLHEGKLRQAGYGACNEMTLRDRA
jgi:hypothetical protein